jgi:hypothetical protein
MVLVDHGSAYWGAAADDIRTAGADGLLSATSGLMHRSKDDRHDVSLDHLVGAANELDWDGTREQDVEVCSLTTTTTGP